MLFKQFFLTRTIIALCFLSSAQAVFSATIHYEFSGTMFQNWTPITSIAVGDQWSASFTIDTDETGETTVFPDPVSPDIVSGEVTTYSNLSGSFTIGSSFYYSFSNDGQVTVGNDRYIEGDPLTGPRTNVADYVSLLTQPNNASVDGLYVEAFWTFLEYASYDNDRDGLIDWNGGVIDSTNLMESTSLDSFLGGAFVIIFEAPDPNNQGPHIVGYVESYNVTISEVPVPTTVWLFSSAILGLAGIKHRQS